MCVFVCVCVCVCVFECVCVDVDVCVFDQQERTGLLNLIDQQHQMEQNELTFTLALEQNEGTERLRKVRSYCPFNVRWIAAIWGTCISVALFVVHLTFSLTCVHFGARMLEVGV